MGALDVARILIAAASLWGTPPTVAGTPPTADTPLPENARAYVTTLADVRPAQRAAARAWDGTGDLPEDLELYAVYEQRLVFELANRPRLREQVIPQLPRGTRAGVRDETRAQMLLSELAAGFPGKPRSEYRTGPAEEAATLWRLYGRGTRRFGTQRSLLAAVNLVETNFNRIRSDSVADAQGPMQFIRPTWAAYGLGGDVRDPADAILGAANYLHANGAPRDKPNALFHYNPHTNYVQAVLAYEKHMRSAAGFRAYYARQLFVRGPGGRRLQLTGIGAR